MGITATVVWVTITTFSVVNDKTIDKAEYSYPTTQSYSECRNDIKSKKNRYYKDKKAKRKQYAYSYKKISCGKRKVGDFSDIFKF